MDPLAHIPGPREAPVLGHSVQFVRDCHRLVDGCRERYGDVFRTDLLGRTQVMFLTPQATREIFLDPAGVLSSERGWETSIGPLFRRGLMLRDFGDHRLHRRAMQEAFSRAALSGYVERIHTVTDRHLADLSAGEVDVYVLMKRLTLDVATEVFVGAPVGQGDTVNRAFSRAIRASVTPFRVPVPGTTYARGLRARRTLERELTVLVERRRAEEAAGREPRPDLLSRLARARTADGDLLPVDEVVDHMVFLLLAAHDTTTSTLAMMLWQLARHPGWQDRVAAEASALAGAPVTLANHADLVGTTLVMDEALRLSPPVPFSPRVAMADLEIDGVHVPAGTAVNTAAVSLHRHPRWWTEPDRFDPDRFAPGRAEQAQHSHLFVPFGGGAHLCLGNHVAELMVKSVVARLLARHRLTADPDARVVFQPVPIPRPRGPLVLTLT